MGFRTVLQHSDVQLTVSEHRIASILLGDPHDCLLLSAAQLAERAAIHESTVIRFAQKLGYAGYPELRADVAADVRQMSDSAAQRFIETAQPYELAAYIPDQLRIITQIPEYVSQESLDLAAAAMLAARRVYIYGLDISRFLVEFMERKLRRMGFDVVGIRHGGHILNEHLLGFTSDDVMLAFAVVSEQRRDISRLLRRIQSYGAVSVLITDQSSMTVRPAPTHLLASPRDTGNRRTLVAPLVICYALEYALAYYGRDRVTASLGAVAAMARADSADQDAYDDHPTRSAPLPARRNGRRANPRAGTSDV
jgi:DNA-binding MurR/RpiR family transcriptional regulator